MASSLGRIGDYENEKKMSEYTTDELRLHREGLWDEQGWAERYVKFMSTQEPDIIASELRTLLTHLSMKELGNLRDIFENDYLDPDFVYI